jgi:hypothetical protein
MRAVPSKAIQEFCNGALDTNGLEMSRIRQKIGGLLSISPHVVRLTYEAPVHSVETVRMSGFEGKNP